MSWVDVYVVVLLFYILFSQCAAHALHSSRDEILYRQTRRQTRTDREKRWIAVLPAQSSESATPNPAEIRRRDRRIEGQREEEEERESKKWGEERFVGDWDPLFQLRGVRALLSK